MQTIAHIVSFESRFVQFEWMVQQIDRSRFRLLFILLNTDSNTALEQFMRNEDIETHFIHYNGKRQLPKAVLKTVRILRKSKVDTIHAHFFDGCLVGLLAAKLAGVKRRIHTRHNSMIHHDYFPKAVKYDRLINSLSTDIIAITKNVQKVLVELEGADPEKIVIIHHGFKLADFEEVSEERISRIRRQYLPEEQPYPVIGVTSRYIHWKGIHHTIPAFKRLLEEYPNAHLVLANARGNYPGLRELLAEIPQRNYTEIKFENDLFALFRVFDVFVHVPINELSEAFGLVYIEAMASRVPSVVTLSGIACDFVEDRKNAMVVPFKDSDAIYTAVKALLTDKDLRNSITENGYRDVTALFSYEQMVRALETLYDKQR